MHKLQRSTAPACLKGYKHGRDKWDQVSAQDKNEIWLKIDEMQKNLCAYCECKICTAPGKRNAHLEHFRQRRSDCYPEGTFLWSNLFASCNRENSCGKHKDKQLPYVYQNLIKADQDDPEDYLSFLPDGSVVPVGKLNSHQRKRAEETIRIFNLNGPLRQIRKSQISGYIQTAEELAAYAAEYDEAEWLPIFRDEMEKIKGLPFATAIRHTIQPEA